MSETWAKDGDRARQASLDLHLDLPGPQSPKGIRLGLEAALRDAVRTGRLGPGTRLPSSRALAGSGTSVAERPAAQPGPGRLARPDASAPRYDLRPGVPDLSAFPRGVWL